MPRRTTITPEERRRMIAEAAYYRARNRGFEGGSAESDWLAAELEIDAQFGCGAHDETEISGLYERLAEETCRHAWDQLRARSVGVEEGMQAVAPPVQAETIKHFCQRLASVNEAICELAEKPISVTSSEYLQRFRRVRQLRRQLADKVAEMRKLSGSEHDNASDAANELLHEIDTDLRRLRTETS